MGVLCCSWKMELDMFKYRGFFFFNVVEGTEWWECSEFYLFLMSAEVSFFLVDIWIFAETKVTELRAEKQHDDLMYREWTKSPQSARSGF